MSPLPQTLRPREVRPSIALAAAATQLGTLAGLGALAILLAGQGPHQVTIALTLIYVTYAMSWNIVAGYAGQFTFGHAAFFGLGSYAATLLTVWIGLPPLFGLWAGVAVAAATAFAIGLITLKLRGLYFGLVTAVFPIVFGVFANYVGLQEVSVPFNPTGGLAFFDPADARVLSAAEHAEQDGLTDICTPNASTGVTTRAAFAYSAPAIALSPALSASA
ncbi:MAG: hypothetical protein NVS2B11_09860 [Acetobacteraceae bacterium]